MKQFTTQNIMIEISKKELEILMDCTNSSYLRYDELYRQTQDNYYKEMMTNSDRIWNQLYLIKKSLPF